MKNQEWHFINKQDWPEGPWKNEPDKMQFVDEKTGLPCLIVRNGGGALCGYVGVSKDHKLFQVDYDSADVNVHGGLTFASKCSPNKEHGICHLVEAGEDDDVWWFGFDCAHWGDYGPGLAKLLPNSQAFKIEEYKTIAYVKEEIASLAQQLSELK